MKKLIFLMAAISLTGCNQFHAMFGANGGHPDYSQTSMVGAGQSNMANENLSMTFDRSVNVAFGGTSIEQWQKDYKWGKQVWETGPQLYAQMLSKVKNHHVILLFWQGETEGLQCTDADQWSNKFTRMVRDLRTDAGYEVQIVYVQIGNTTLPHPCWEEVQNEQASLQGHLPGVLMVSAKDLLPHGDGLIHYAQDQYKEMQGRMLNALEVGE